ncbi:putative ribonuclease H-like domain-containing protein [Tanacetum coccineum]
MERELGAGYSFERKTCFVCGSLSHLIKDCDYYEKKMAREAALKSQRVVHADVRQATPAWTNTNRVNKANQFTPRPVQLSNIRPNLSTASKTIKTGRVNVNIGHGNVNSGSVHVNSGTQIKSGASRINTGKQHINSGSMHVNTGTQIKSGAHINSGRVNRPVSNNTSPKLSQVNLTSPKKCFSKQRSPVNRPFSRNTAHQSNKYAVKGKMGTAVKTSAGCVWRKIIPLSNTNSGPTPDSNVNVSRGPILKIIKNSPKWDLLLLEEVKTEEAADLMVVSSTSLTEATRKAAVSEKLAKKKTHSPKQPSFTPISKSADDIMAFRKELDVLALKHLGPVPATAPTSTNPVNTGSITLNTSFEKVNTGNTEAISPSTDHEEEVFSDADDDEMPEIRIYDKSSEDEVDVPTNPTLRIHNAHPQSQILGDPNTPVQTRSSLKDMPAVTCKLDADWLPVTPSPIPSNKRQNWNQGMERELGAGYSFERKTCFVYGSLSHLIKDCDYYERKMAREAALKSQRVVHADVQQATPAWTNTNRRSTRKTQACEGMGPKEKLISFLIVHDHPLKHMEHRGIFDSGCSRHMTGNRAHLEDYKELSKVGSVTFGGSKGSISGKECFVVSSDFKMPDENQVLLKVPRQHNMYTFDMKNVDSSKGYTCLLAKASSDEAKLWHRRLCHLNFKNLNKLVKGNLVRGLPSKSFKNDHTCVACQKGKQHKASCKAKIDRYVTHPLHTLHMDLFGPTSVRSINHASYCLVITDDCSSQNLEEMDINWQIAMIAIKIKKFYKKIGRRPRVESLEKELSDTKQTLGTVVLQLIKKIKKLENKLRQKRKREDAEGQDQDIPSQTDQGNEFATPEKSKDSGEAQAEQISPSTLEAAQILTNVASEGFKGSQAPLGSKIYRRKPKSTATPTKVLDFEEPAERPVNTGSTPSAQVNTGSTPSAQVNTGSTPSAQVNTGEKERVQRREGKAPMTEEDLQAEVQASKKSKELAGLEAAQRLQATMDAETQRQIDLDALLARRLVEQEEEAAKEALATEFDYIQARLNADQILAEKIQQEEREQYSIEDRAKFLHDTIAAQRKFLAEQRYAAIRNKPPTISQLRNQMITYLKHVANKKHAELKSKSFEEIQVLYERYKKQDQTFVAIGSEEDERAIKKMNEKAVNKEKEQKDESVHEEVKEEEGAKKRKLGTRRKLKAKRRKYTSGLTREDDDLKICLHIAPDEDKVVDVEILDHQYPIIEWQSFFLTTKPQHDQTKPDEDIYLNKVTRSNGHQRFFRTLMGVLSILDREDLKIIYELVMEEYKDRLPEGFDRMLWGDLMIMFNQGDTADFWDTQQDWNLISWKLHSSSGVHTIMTSTGLVFHMLVESKYPLTKEVLSQMLELKLETEEESSMALELIKFVKQQLEEFEDSNDDDHGEEERGQLSVQSTPTLTQTVQSTPTLTQPIQSPTPPPQPSSVQLTSLPPPIQPEQPTPAITFSSPPITTIPDTQPTHLPSPQIPSPPYYETEGPSFEPSYHMSPPPSHEPEIQTSRTREEIILPADREGQELRNKLRQKRKREEPEYEEDAVGQDQDIPSQTDQGNTFVTPEKSKVSGEAQLEQISPSTLEAAQILTNVASEGLPVTTTSTQDNTGRQPSAQVNTGKYTFQLELNTGETERVQRREGKDPMTEEDLQAEVQASKKSREQELQELAGLEAAQRLQATMDAEAQRQIHLDALLARRLVEQEEEAAKEALATEFDYIQVRLNADQFLAEKIQQEEREQYSIEDRAKFLHDTIAAQRKFLAE